MLKDGFYVTNRGRTLIAGLMAGDTFAISKVMVGSGRPETLTALAEMTDLVSPVAAATSTKPLRKGDTVEMIIEYRSDLNGGLETGFWLNEFAVYAMDGDTEVMIYYGCLGDYPQWVSAYKDGAVDIRRYPVSLKVSADVQVKVSYPSMAFMTAEDCTQYISAHNSDSEAHPAIQNKFDRLLGEIDPLSGVGEPTSTTEGQVGQKYEDTTSGDIYTCTAITPGESGASPHYLWVPGRLGTLAEIRTAYSNIRGRIVGEQLLHNAYWAAKEYIINQQGQSSYTGLGYGIDRWVVEQNATLQIMDDCISIDASYSSGILQKLDYGTLPTSLTFSVLVKEGVGGIFISNHPVQMIDGPGLYSITFSEIINPATDYAYIRAWDNKNLKLKAAKLELGPVQTLAHKEGDTWVLNDPPPDPALELLKCKKYLQPMMFSAWSCVDKHISTKGEFLLTFESRMFPVQMRANPIIINPDDIWISNQSYNTWYKPLSVNSCCTKYTCLLSVALEEEIYNSRDKFFLWSGKIAGVGSPILFSADL